MLAFLNALAVLSPQSLDIGGIAPELVSGTWLNTDKPVTLKSREGKVTVVHFWTFECSNCKANLPAYARLYAKFKPLGVEFVGVHTPELAEERDERNVRSAVKRLGLTFPVLIDGEGKNWDRWKQSYWPTVYVVNRDGVIQMKWEGELGYHGASGESLLDEAIRKTLKNARSGG